MSATVFYKYPEYRELLQQAFEKMCEITFQHLPKLKNFEEKPELTEDFFGMLIRYGRYTPQLMLMSNSWPTILELSLMGIGIDHKQAAKSLYAWLEVLCKLVWNKQDDTFKQEIPLEQKQSNAPSRLSLDSPKNSTSASATTSSSSCRGSSTHCARDRPTRRSPTTSSTSCRHSA